jgi:hypothetical protein
VAARQGAPVLGVLCERPKDGKAPRKELWDLTIGYRYLPSHRHFVGTVEQKQRAVLGTEIVNKYHIFDVSVGYQLSPRWSLNASIPVTKAYRNQLYAPVGVVNWVSQGDATFGFRRWLFRPPTESRRNIGVGMSLKVPTGRFRETFTGVRAGQTLVATADQSVQPGDGGTGFTMDFNAYTPAVFGSWAYAQGLYLVNPRNTNGVSTFRTRPGETVMSVSDQYLFRGGMTRLLPKQRLVAVSMGMRLEGVPVRDLIGGSLGFRRPGYSLSVDPGLMWNIKGYTFALSGPMAVRRNRKRSVPDFSNGIHGDAAFADYSVIFAVTRRF